MELVDILVLGTSAEKRAGSNPAEGIFKFLKVKKNRFISCNMLASLFLPVLFFNEGLTELCFYLITFQPPYKQSL